MTISVALIVKNEEPTLGRCLDSLQGAVDEIVVVDTGSDDATKEVAGRYTNRIFDFEWCRDFAAARQFAFDRATGDWVAWVDADDVVLHAEQIRPMVRGAPAEVGGFYCRYVTARDTWGNSQCEFWRERCVRNDGTFRWAGRVHEVLVTEKPWRIERSDAVIVEHRGKIDHNPAGQRRNLDILEEEYAASGDSPSPRLLYYLGREYAGHGAPLKAIQLLQQYLQVAQWDDERYQAQTQVSELYRGQQRYQQAINADLQALKLCPHWPDAYFGLARSYYYLREWHKVIHWTEMGRAMPRPDTLHFVNPMDQRYNWLIFYTNALYHVGELQEALNWTQHALQICPDDPQHQQNLHFIAGALQESRCVPTPGAEAVREAAPVSSHSASLPPVRSDRLRVIWEGPQFLRASFGRVNRELCSALLCCDPTEAAGQPAASEQDENQELELSVRPVPPVEFGPDEDPELFLPLAARMDACLAGPADVHVRMTYLPLIEPPPSGRWVIFQPWDYGSMPLSWLDLFQNHADEVWVPSRFVWRSYVDSGVSPEKVQVIPLGVNPLLFHPAVPPRPIPTDASFKFLFVGGTLWRKGIDVLLDAYAEAFGPQDDVCLIIKDVGANSYYRDHNARERICHLQGDPDAPEILYLTEDLPDRAVAGIFTACDCLVHPYRGEGFALPVAEAMACGLPVIVTQGGACDDFCTDETVYWIPGERKPFSLWETAAAPAWALEPDRHALVQRLREIYDHRGEARQKGTRASEHILQNFTWHHAARAARARFRQLAESGA